MKVLVTGANGFLGQAVVSAFLQRGHEVRALVRPATNAKSLPWADRVEFCVADLRAGSGLEHTFDGVDAVVHLAACVIGDDATHFASTIGGTERLLAAMAAAKNGPKRLVLASTLSVYGWRKAGGGLSETTLIDEELYQRGAYAIAKVWQERLCRRMSEANGWRLTVLRPGVIWGPAHEQMPLIGPAIGPIQFVIGFRRQLPLTYIENCAECFVRATEDDRSAGEIFNLLDGDSPGAWRFAGEYLRWAGLRRVRVPVPYSACMLVARIATACSKIVFKGKGKVPSLLMPCRLAIFRPMRLHTDKFRKLFGWRQPVDTPEAIRRVFHSQKQVAITNASRQENAERDDIAGQIEQSAQKARGAPQGS